MNCIYRVTEKNVDGCGGDATEFVLFHQALDRTASALFAHLLKDAKFDARGDANTGEMVSDALEQFAKETGIRGSITGAPYIGVFEF